MSRNKPRKPSQSRQSQSRPASSSSESKVASPTRRRRLVGIGGLSVAVVLAVWAGLTIYGTGSNEDRNAHPNILLITMDTTRADFLSCYGRGEAATPVLDALAAEGARFDQCISCVPLTLPSHSSILTGLYPFEHGVRRNGVDRLVDGNQTLTETLKEAGYSTQATVAAYVLDGKFGVSQGFDVYHDVVVTGADDPLLAERKGTDIATDACTMLRKLADKQFFLWVHFFDPHHPYESDKYPDTSSEAYAEEVAFMDTQIGRVLDALDELELRDNTLVVAVGDHGEGLGDHEEPRHGTFLYNSTLRVPLIMRLPGHIGPAQVIDANVRTIDIAPTALELVGLPGMSRIQGKSLVPLLTGAKATDLDLAAYGESFEAQANYGASQLRSLQVGDWKYVLAPKPELYDLATDPAELNNLIDREPELAANLREQMRTLIAEASPPPGGESAAVALDASDLAKLAALGYIGADSDSTQDGRDELDRFEPEGMNPRDVLPIAEQIVQAREAVRQGKASEGEATLRSLIDQMPDAPRLLADLANAVGVQGRTNDAIDIYERAVIAAPNDRYIRRLYARFLMNSGKVEAALEQYTVMLQATPDDTTALHEAGIALIRLGRLQEAEQHIQIALRIEPGTPRLLHAMGYLRFNQRRYPEAAQYFRKTLKIDPNYTASREALEKIEAAYAEKGLKL